MRRTKIIATLGPATEDPETLARLFEAGTDVVRINFSHGSRDDHERQVTNIREVSSRLGRHIGIIGDLQGPKIRIDRFAAGSVSLQDGQSFALDSSLDPDAGTQHEVGVAYAGLIQDVGPGDVLLLDDGQIVLSVSSVDDTRINCTVTVGGELGDRKGINRQGGGLSASALTDRDLMDVQTAAELDVDWLAVSFVREADDIERARRHLRKAGGQAHIIAKIERADAIDNLESIIDASDAVMVARGDLAVEMGYAALAGLQKRIMRMTRNRHKVCITAFDA